MTRFVLLASFVLALGCSSNDDATTDSGSGVNACLAAGGYCAQNFPFTCTGGYEAATDPDRAKACGQSSGDTVRDISCCLRVSTPPEDTGTPDMGTTDSSTEETGDASTEAGDASTEAGDAAEAG